MNRLIPAFVILLLVSTPCLAQQSLVGTYKLVGVQRIFDGNPEAPPTKPPHGYLVLTPTVSLSSSRMATAGLAHRRRKRLHCGGV